MIIKINSYRGILKVDYPIRTGDADKERLDIVNALYNPTTCLFMKENGLAAGMTVLEIGCGLGQMAIWMAQQVGDKGKVIAIDNSELQLAIAKQCAKKAGIHNIDFILLDVRQVNTLNKKFDLIFGRAILEFLANGESRDVFNQLLGLLNKSGVFIYESFNAVDNAGFSYPHRHAIDKFYEMNDEYFKKTPLLTNFSENIYNWYIEAKLDDIKVKASQPVLMTEAQKRLIQLCVLNTRDSVYHDYNADQFNDFIKELVSIENDPSVIIGFLRSILYKGQR